MKFRILVFLCFIGNSLFAQSYPEYLWGNWVATKITNRDGTPLPDDEIVKYSYLRYTFSPPDVMFTAIRFDYKGLPVKFEIKDKLLIIKTSGGSIVNVIKIEELNADRLVLLNGGREGFDSPNAIRYYFMNETDYQNTVQLTINDIHSVYNNDTTYEASPKAYAQFKGEDLQKFLYDHIDAGTTKDNTSGHLVASFLVLKSGRADSLKILESISPAFDKLFEKAFEKTTRNWKPAIINGRYVNVRMLVELRYSTFGAAFPADQYTNEAAAAFIEKKYDKALYYYNLALKSIPFDTQNLYRRGICKKMLGNLAGACADWMKVKELGGIEANELLDKYCN